MVCGPLEQLRLLHTFFLWMSITFWGILLHSWRSAISSPGKATKALDSLQCIVRVCSRHLQSDLSQKSMLPTSHAVLFPFQAYYPQVKIYEVWHYHELKDRNRKLLQCNVRHDILASRLHTFGPSILTDSIQVHTSTYADSASYHQSTSCVQWSFLYEL